jgi:hypothetical protein
MGIVTTRLGYPSRVPTAKACATAGWTGMQQSAEASVTTADAQIRPELRMIALPTSF